MFVVFKENFKFSSVFRFSYNVCWSGKVQGVWVGNDENCNKFIDCFGKIVGSCLKILNDESENGNF